MFFKRKTKTDYKLRFQNSRFQQSLKEARGYKREKRAIPKTAGAVFLSKIGLRTWAARLISLFIVGLLFYFVYIPNFFYVKNIEVNHEGTNILSTVNSFLEQKSPWPQKNLLLLSKKDLENYILINNRKILEVEKISKKLPNTLVVQIAPRVDEFAIESGQKYYIVSNDGLVTKIATDLQKNLVLIKLETLQNLNVEQETLSLSKINFILTVQNRLSRITRSDVLNYGMKDLKSLDLAAHFASGFKIYFDLNSDAHHTLGRLKTLLDQYSDEDLKKISYVDMRFTNRAYICNLGLPCEKDVNFQLHQTASSSPTFISAPSLSTTPK